MPFLLLPKLVMYTLNQPISKSKDGRVCRIFKSEHFQFDSYERKILNGIKLVNIVKGFCFIFSFKIVSSLVCINFRCVKTLMRLFFQTDQTKSALVPMKICIALIPFRSKDRTQIGYACCPIHLCKRYIRFIKENCLNLIEHSRFTAT